MLNFEKCNNAVAMCLNIHQLHILQRYKLHTVGDLHICNHHFYDLHFKIVIYISYTFPTKVKILFEIPK